MEFPRDSVLDLHGRTLNEAIGEVTSFLERIRSTRSYAAAPRGSRGQCSSHIKIITGSGSHSNQGPVLRIGVQKLLQKRGMKFKLERGGGAFLVDAFSGWDLYKADEATDTKVLILEQDQFYQIARERNFARPSTGSIQQGMRAVSAHPLAPPTRGYGRSNTDPLPSEEESEDDDIRLAVQMSIDETHKHRNLQVRMESEYGRALLESQSEHVAYSQKRLKEEIEFRRALSSAIVEQFQNETKECGRKPSSLAEGEQSLIEMISERSVFDEQQRHEQVEKSFEEDLGWAIFESAKLEIDKREEDEKSNAAEEELLSKILAESLEEREKAISSEELLLQKVMEESLLEEENLKATEQGQLQTALSQSLEEGAKAPGEGDLIENIIRLSLKEQEIENMDEEEAIRKALDLSVQDFQNATKTN